MMVIIGDFLGCVSLGEGGVVVLCLVYVCVCVCIGGPAQGGMNCLSSGHCLDHLADCISAVD